jgi:hypothetical protein
MSERLTHWLADIERANAGVDKDTVYLWPDTPVNALRAEIKRRVGADDTETNDTRSRSRRIIHAMRTLEISSGAIVLDVCCGDARILSEVKFTWPDMVCCGVDILAGALDGHTLAMQSGVLLYRAPIQALFSQNAPRKFDVVMMLNTFRDWKSAHLRKSESGLPETAERWLFANARHLFLTVNDWQAARFEALPGVMVDDLGRGEDKSTLIHVEVLE